MAVKAKVDTSEGVVKFDIPNGTKVITKDLDLLTSKGELEMGDYKETKIVVRRVGAMIAGDALTVSEVEPYLNSILADGWKLFSVMHLETAQEGYTFAWMFVR